MALAPATRRSRILCTTAVVVLCASPAAAQDDTGFFQMLGRIILGAGNAKVAIDTPQAVTSIETEELERGQPETLSDLFQSVPGVQGAGASARPLGQAFNIRGIGNSEQTASEARIIVTVDGAPKFFEQYRMGSFFGDLDLFKRIEVLRGPASSTLYGSGAIGGVINFTTKDASDFLEEGQSTAVEFRTGIDTNGNGQRAGVVFANRQEGAEYLGALNWTTSGDRTDGNGATIPGTGYDSLSGLLKGRWSFGQDADQSLSLSLARTDSDLENTPVAQTGGGAAITGFGNHDMRAIDDTVTLTWDHGFAANPLLDLSVQLSYTDTAVEKRNFRGAPISCGPGLFAVLCDSDFGYSATSLKIENQSEFGSGAWQNFLTVGVQVTEQERSATSTVGRLAFHPEGVDRKTGVYVQGEFIWNERLTVIPGLRVDFGDLTPGPDAIALGGRPQTDTAISPKLALHYKLNDEFAIFGSAAQTERMPTLDELYSTELPGRLPQRLPSLNLRKEEADTIELGLSFQRDGLLAEGDVFQIKATGFHNDLTNMIATTPRRPGGPPVTFFSNINRAELWGGEIEAAYEAERWFAQLAYSNVRSRDRSTGFTLNDTPAENVVLTLGAKLPERDLTLGWRASYFDAIVTGNPSATTPASTTAAAYNTHDIFVTWTPADGALAGLDVNLSVNNVFDASYRNNLELDQAIGRNAKLSITKTVAW